MRISYMTVGLVCLLAVLASLAYVVGAGLAQDATPPQQQEQEPQTPARPAERDVTPAQLGEQFARAVAEGRLEEGFDLLERNSNIAEAQLSGLQEKAAGDLQRLQSALGEARGYELVAEEQVKDVLVRYTYLIRYERFPMRWTLTFYKPQDQWRLITLAYSDNMSELFDN